MSDQIPPDLWAVFSDRADAAKDGQPERVMYGVYLGEDIARRVVNLGQFPKDSVERYIPASRIRARVAEYREKAIAAESTTARILNNSFAEVIEKLLEPTNEETKP